MHVCMHVGDMCMLKCYQQRSRNNRLGTHFVYNCARQSRYCCIACFHSSLLTYRMCMHTHTHACVYAHAHAHTHTHTHTPAHTVGSQGHSRWLPGSPVSSVLFHDKYRVCIAASPLAPSSLQGVWHSQGHTHMSLPRKKKIQLKIALTQ